jgi:hypothetical protein
MVAQEQVPEHHCPFNPGTSYEITESNLVAGPRSYPESCVCDLLTDESACKISILGNNSDYIHPSS